MVLGIDPNTNFVYSLNRCKSFATILLYKIKKLLKAMKHEVYERQEE